MPPALLSMDNLSPPEILKLLEAEAKMLQEMHSKVANHLHTLKVEEDLILHSSAWMQGQQSGIVEAEDLALLPPPLSPLREPTVDGMLEDEQERHASGQGVDGDQKDEEDNGYPSDFDDELKAYFDAEADDVEEDDEPG